MLILEKAPRAERGGNTAFTGGLLRFPFNGMDEMRPLIPDYTDDELEEIAGRAGALAESAGEVHVAFNNNRGDDAPTAAQRFRALLGQDVPEPDDPQLTL